MLFDTSKRPRWIILTAALTLTCFYQARMEFKEENYGLSALQLMGGFTGFAFVPRLGGLTILEYLPGGMGLSTVLLGTEGIGALECWCLSTLGLFSLFATEPALHLLGM